MPVKPLRRLSVNATSSLFDEIERHTLSTAWSRTELERSEREHPELLLRRRSNVVAAIAPSGALAYAFENNAAFVDEFPAMLESLLPRMRKAGIETARFRLTHNPARPVVEHVLKRLWFSPSRSWLLFSLDKRDAPKAGALSGVKFRDGGPTDIDEMIRIDRAAFPNTPLPRDAMERRLAEGSRVLLAITGKKVGGFAIYNELRDGPGYLYVLAVDDEHRGRGIGEALTARVAKAAFAEGAQRLELRTDDDNAKAIRLYARMGFRQTAAGRDYTRPTDPREISRIKKVSEGTVIRFGGWR